MVQPNVLSDNDWLFFVSKKHVTIKITAQSHPWKELTNLCCNTNTNQILIPIMHPAEGRLVIIRISERVYMCTF